MDYIASVLDRLSESQQGVQTAGKAAASHQDGGYTPHDRIRALDVLIEDTMPLSQMKQILEGFSHLFEIHEIREIANLLREQKAK